MDRLRDWWAWWKDIVYFTLVLLVIVGIISGGVVGCSLVSGRVFCEREAGIRGLEHRWDWMTGCYVLQNDRWVDLEEFIWWDEEVNR